MSSVCFLVNGGASSAAGRRAEAFATRLADRYDVSLVHRGPRKLASAAAMAAELIRTRPSLCYVVDMAYAGVLAAAVGRVARAVPVIVDTGDAIYELAKSVGERGPLRLALTRALEELGLRVADRVVVRGTLHATLLEPRGLQCVVVQDGVDLAAFRPAPSPDVRRRYGLDGALTVGLVGTSVWNESHGFCYGWDLVELLARLGDAPVKGVMIGGGNGIERLRTRARELGVDDRIVFTGYVEPSELADHLNAIDVCLSTQSDDVPGRVRTTGKLPLYLATGRYVLASRVGEASLVLPEEMLVPYDGVRDDAYPARLAERVRSVLARPEALREARALGPELARRFDYDVLAERVADVIASTLVERTAA